MAQDPNQSKLSAESEEAETDLQQTESINPETAPPDLLDLAGALHPRQKVSLIKSWITQLPSLELEIIQKLIESEEKERTEREQGVLPSSKKILLHRIKVKKDYSFRKLGLPLPQQYFVTIAQKYRVHNDIYLGVLFFIQKGYFLNYVISKQGVVQFDPKTSIFRLESSVDREKVKFVRLVMLVPPPPDYDVAKIKSETALQVPCFLHVEILNAKLQLIDREQHQFPACMYRREVFDRDYWDIVSVVEAKEVSQSSALDSAQITSLPDSKASNFPRSSNTVAPTPKPVRPLRGISLPKIEHNSIPFIVVNQVKLSLMTTYLRQLAVLSQKAFPNSHWRLNLQDLNYKLLHSSERIIVEIRVNDREVLIENMPLNILSDWCRSLGVAISQNVSSTRYTEKDREIARSLMIEFSAEITDPQTFIEKFFYRIKGVQFKRKT